MSNFDGKTLEQLKAEREELRAAIRALIPKKKSYRRFLSRIEKRAEILAIAVEALDAQQPPEEIKAQVSKLLNYAAIKQYLVG